MRLSRARVWALALFTAAFSLTGCDSLSVERSARWASREELTEALKTCDVTRSEPYRHKAGMFVVDLDPTEPAYESKSQCFDTYLADRNWIPMV
ncbi:MAG: hypothetical protein AVDCRST_MAG93-5985 [uncultured Chloroflexia bacterium]|uniref:Uncharacterized protein n=1 Tax=uncultured Chloroflexia bacterium TaxID=1672391 RepID=A0A6J4LE45_9CHLR|nr:MAG: hypothetical protein AVDCRST_MAG93-5985 [uncultured Chloroflexia bacterium]